MESSEILPLMYLKGSVRDGFAHDLVNSCLKFYLKELGKNKTVIFLSECVKAAAGAP